MIRHNPHRKLRLLLTGLLVFLALPATAQNQTSYPMFCKNGHGMTFNIKSAHNVTTVTIQFKDGWAGTDSEPVQPGHCSWKDRGLRNGEPRQIIMTFRDIWTEFTFNDEGRVTFSAPWTAGADQQDVRNFQYVLRAMRSGSQFNFHVYQVQRSTAQGGNFFSVRQVGP